MHGSYERWRDDGDDPSEERPQQHTRASSRVTAAVVIVVLLAGSLYGCRVAFTSSLRPAGALSPSPPSAREVMRFPSVAIIVRCARSHTAADDPILHSMRPGASHDHTFFGNTATRAISTQAMLRAAPTTCDDAADRSAYWLPTPVGASWRWVRVYYDRGALPAVSITAPPAGFMLLSDRAEWSCHRDREQTGWSASPPRDCVDGLRARVSFAQCWNGTALRPPMHVVPAVNARCPKTHPVALARLELVGELDGVPSALSSGSLSEVGVLHGDFWNAWDQSRLERLVAMCIRGERAANPDLKQCARQRSGGRAQ